MENRYTAVCPPLAEVASVAAAEDDGGGERYRQFLVDCVSLHSVRPAVRREHLLILLIPDTCVVGFDLLLRGELRKIRAGGFALRRAASASPMKRIASRSAFQVFQRTHD